MSTFSSYASSFGSWGEGGARAELLLPVGLPTTGLSLLELMRPELMRPELMRLALVRLALVR